jgi:hypothetical protein
MGTGERRRHRARRTHLGCWGDMKLRTRGAALAGAILLAVSAAGLAAAAASQALPVLGRLDAGLYELRNLHGGGRFAPVCLGEDRGALVQLQHRRSQCSRSVVARTRDRLEVRYNCAGAFGQTTIRVETARLARIESEGVDNGMPFSLRIEARRVGSCR